MKKIAFVGAVLGALALLGTVLKVLKFVMLVALVGAAVFIIWRVFVRPAMKQK